MSHHLENPFYYNYIFREIDKDRMHIRWWNYPILLFCQTYVQINDGYVFYFKRHRGRYFLMKVEPFEGIKEKP